MKKQTVLSILFVYGLTTLFALNSFADTTESSTSKKLTLYTTVDQKDLSSEDLKMISLDLARHKAKPIKEDQPIEVIIETVNDSTIDTDDEGYTYGLKIAGIIPTDKGVRVKVQYTADLYTNFVSHNANGGHKDVKDQFFTNETIYEIVVDNYSKNKLLYWSAGAAWQRVDSRSTSNSLDASSHQDWFHGLFSKLSETVLLEDGRGLRDGALVHGSVGVQKQMGKGRVRLETKSDVGGRLAEVKHADYARVSTENSVILKMGRFESSFDFGGTIKKHFDGVEYQPYVGAGFATKSFSLDLRESFFYGDAHNYQVYNIRSEETGKYEPVTTLTMSYRFW